MNDCSAVIDAVLRCDARGAAIASGSVMPWSSRLVSVYATTLPHLSAATRCVVERPFVSCRWFVAVPLAHCEYCPFGEFGGTGFVAACCGSIRQDRSAPKLLDSSSSSGTSTYAGSP